MRGLNIYHHEALNGLTLSRASLLNIVMWVTHGISVVWVHGFLWVPSKGADQLDGNSFCML